MLLNYLIIILAAWRLTILIVREEGPFNIFGRIRKAAGVKLHETAVEIEGVTKEDGNVFPIVDYHIVKEPSPVQSRAIARGITCVYCTSVYIGLFFVGLGLLIGVEKTTLLAAPFALSTAIIIVERYT